MTVVVDIKNLGSDLVNKIGVGCCIGSIIDHLETFDNKDNYIVALINNLNKTLHDYTERYGANAEA